MSWPANRSDIQTNLPQFDFQELCDALENAESSGVNFQPGIQWTSYFECKFNWRGSTYRLNKIDGIVVALNKM